MSIDFEAPRAYRDIRNGDWFWISKYVWNDTNLTSSDKVVYGTLAYFANNEQASFPSINRIAEFSDISKRQVYISIKKLENKKYVSIKKGGGRGYKSTYYLMKIEKVQNMHRNEERVHTLHETVQNSTIKGEGPGTTNNTYINNTIKQEEEVLIPSKKTNPLMITRGQTISFLKAFSTLTTSELKEQMKLCNNYMGMSSEKFKNPGLFFRKWLERYTTEKRKKVLEEKKELEQNNAYPDLTEEQRQRNLERIMQIKESLKFKSI